MAEVPPHLLERSRSRRAALGLGEADESTPVASPATESAAVVARAAAPAPAAPVLLVKEPEKPSRPARPVRPAIPRFALPMLLLLPVWAISYVSVFAAQKEKAVGPAAVGASVFAANCATCHLADGAGSDNGGVGRPLWKGEVEKTFPAEAEQIAYVKRGSYAAGTPYGNPKRAGGQHVAKGGMPKWEGALTEEQITAVVEYERSVLQGQPFPSTTLAPAH